MTTIDLIPTEEEAPPAEVPVPAEELEIIPAAPEPKKRGRPPGKKAVPPAPIVEEEPPPQPIAKEKKKPKPKAVKPKVTVQEEEPPPEVEAEPPAPVLTPRSRRQEALAQMARVRREQHQRKVAMYTQMLDKSLGY